MSGGSPDPCRVVHAITPGDHYSPNTGSAIPTVVDGIARAATQHGDPEQSVLVARGTYPDRYPGAQVLEYDQDTRILPRWQRLAEILAGRVGRPRRSSRSILAPMLSGQEAWAPSVVLAHNLVELVPQVGPQHSAVLYAHNELLRTYSRGEVRRTLDRAAVVVAVSEYLAERLRSQLPPALAGRIAAIPNGADCAAFRPASDDAYDGPLRIVYLGRMVPYKGPDVLLEAIRRLGRSDVCVTMIGGADFDPQADLTPYEQELRTAAAACPAKVRFLHFVTRLELTSVLPHHDLMVMPSRWPEPWGLTVSEGQACGLPVIASAIGGIPEAAADPDLLVPPDDPDALAGLIGRFADDRDAARRAGVRSREHAVAHDWSASWRRLSAVLPT